MEKTTRTLWYNWFISSFVTFAESHLTEQRWKGELRGQTKCRVGRGASATSEQSIGQNTWPMRTCCIRVIDDVYASHPALLFVASGADTPSLLSKLAQLLAKSDEIASESAKRQCQRGVQSCDVFLAAVLSGLRKSPRHVFLMRKTTAKYPMYVYFIVHRGMLLSG